MTGAIFIFEFWLFVMKIPEIEEKESATVILTSGNADIILHKLEEEFDIQKLDTLNDTTYIITLCKQQTREK